jgi:acyl-CoA thioester hydrolase
MPEQSSVVSTSIRVRYAETDQMGVAYYANYLVWFEVARGAFCRERGIDYAQMEEQGLFLPILEAHCRYRSPARYDDEVTVEIHVAELKSRTVRFGYRLTRGETLVAEGETLQMLIGRDNRPRSWPADIAARFIPNA